MYSHTCFFTLLLEYLLLEGKGRNSQWRDGRERKREGESRQAHRDSWHSDITKISKSRISWFSYWFQRDGIERLSNFGHDCVQAHSNGPPLLIIFPWVKKGVYWARIPVLTLNTNRERK